MGIAGIAFSKAQILMRNRATNASMGSSGREKIGREKGKTMSEHIAGTTSWIRKRDKYHEYWQCAKCGGRILKYDQRAEPPEKCPYCRRRMSGNKDYD